MRVLLLAPFLSGPLRGNAVHAERKAKLLRDAGIEVELLDGSKPLPDKLPEAEALVALHGWRTSAHIDAILRQAPMPYYLVTTGTDVPPGLPDGKRDIAKRNFARATRIIVQHPEQSREIDAAFPDLNLAGKCFHVPPSVSLDLARAKPPFSGESVRLLHISGIRPIKGVGFIPEFMQSLWRKLPEADYTLLGAALEDAYAAPVLEWIEAQDQAQRLELTHGETLAKLAEADVLLSTSRHEGLSNALLEAMAIGTPVVATNIAPNRELIEDGATGLLYDGKAGFVEAIMRLHAEPGLAASLAEAAQSYVARRHSPAIEQAMLLAALDL